ncbi:MAG: substrate-binding domain-containing protein, partial [Bacilli bacterium]
MRHKFKILFLLTLVFLIVGTGCNSPDPNKVFRILAGSENKDLEPYIREIVAKEGYTLEMDYHGSVDSMRKLEAEEGDYDAVWLPSPLWITLGDKGRRVKGMETVFITPIVWGVRADLAKSLNLTREDVKMRDILNVVKENKLHFAMTSASQSNSGTYAYLSFLQAFIGKEDALTSRDLHNTTVVSEIKSLLQGVERSSASSGFLQEMFVKGNYDAQVNYENLIIKTNEALVAQGKTPLHVVYPTDASPVSESTIGYIDRGDSEKQEVYNQLVTQLGSEKMRNVLQQSGRRLPFVKDYDAGVFKPEWGIDTSRVLTSFRLPHADVLREAIDLYQTSFKKASYTFFVLDYSGSMAENGGESQLKEAMRLLLNQTEAKKWFLQASERDVLEVLAFNSVTIDRWRAKGKSEFLQVQNEIEQLQAGGGTNMYVPLAKIFEEVGQISAEDYYVSVVVLTDGQSEMAGKDKILQSLQSGNVKVPVYSITFGDADESQLDELAQLSNSTVFDG